MTILNADKLIFDIAAGMRQRLDDVALGLLRGNGPTRSEYATFSHPGNDESNRAIGGETPDPPRLDMDELRRTRYMGLPVHTSPLLPAYKARVTLSQKLDVSEEFRADMDAWLRDFFGEDPYAVVARVPGSRMPGYQEAIFCNPRIEDEILRKRASGKAFT